MEIDPLICYFGFDTTGFVIGTSYQKADPQTVENLVTMPLFLCLEKLSGLKNIMSSSSKGYSFIKLEFQEEVGLDDKIADVQNQLDQVKGNLPDDVEIFMIMGLYSTNHC